MVRAPRAEQFMDNNAIRGVMRKTLQFAESRLRSTLNRITPKSDREALDKVLGVALEAAGL